MANNRDCSMKRSNSCEYYRTYSKCYNNLSSYSYFNCTLYNLCIPGKKINEELLLRRVGIR